MSKSIIYKIKEMNRDKGKYFFSKSTMKFFNSRVQDKTIENRENGKVLGAWFTTSEKFDNNSLRLYTMRYCDYKTGEVRTVGEFQGHKSAKAAWQWLRINGYPTK